MIPTTNPSRLAAFTAMRRAAAVLALLAVAAPAPAVSAAGLRSASGIPNQDRVCDHAGGPSPDPSGSGPSRCDRPAAVDPGAQRIAPIAKAGTDPTRSDIAVANGCDRMTADLQHDYWDADAPSHIRPTNGGNPASRNGLIDTTLPFPSFWQMESVENVMYWRWKLTGSPAIRAKLVSQWAYVQSVFPPAVLAGAGAGITINISDDAAWVANYLAHAHEVTGDPRALAALGEMIAATALRFADPNQAPHALGTTVGARFAGAITGTTLTIAAVATGVVAVGQTVIGAAPRTIIVGLGTGTGGAGTYRVDTSQRTGVTGSHFAFQDYPHGMLYAAASDTAALNEYGYVSTAYEAMLANAAFYYYRQTGNAAYRQFAADAYAWIKRDLSTPAPADGTRKAQSLIETALDLDPRAHGTAPTLYGHARNAGANPTYLKPQNAYFGKPIRGVDSTYAGGAMAEAVLGARLYGDGGNPSYLADIGKIVGAMVSPQGYRRTVRGRPVFVNSRDPWTDGYWAPSFVDEVLSITAADPADTWRAMAVDTAAAITATRTPAGRYGADWSGPETNIVDGTTTWQQAYRMHPGGQAGDEQIMTNASSVSMAQAGCMVEAGARRR